MPSLTVELFGTRLNIYSLIFGGMIIINHSYQDEITYTFGAIPEDISDLSDNNNLLNPGVEIVRLN